MEFAEVTISPKQIEHNSNIHILKPDWHLFPDEHRTIELEKDGTIIVYLFNPKYHEFAFGKWYSLYQLKAGDKIRFIPKEPKKRYQYKVEFEKKSTP